MNFVDPPPPIVALDDGFIPHPGFGEVQLVLLPSEKVIVSDVHGDWTCRHLRLVAQGIGRQLTLDADAERFRLRVNGPMSEDEYALEDGMWVYRRRIGNGFA